MLQDLILATQSSNVFMPGKDPLWSVLQSPPYDVGPHVPLPMVPTGNGLLLMLRLAVPCAPLFIAFPNRELAYDERPLASACTPASSSTKLPVKEDGLPPVTVEL